MSARICVSPLFVGMVIFGSTFTDLSTKPRHAAATAIAAVPIPMYEHQLEFPLRASTRLAKKLALLPRAASKTLG